MPERVELTFEELLRVAEESNEVVGLYVFGSRGRNFKVDARSDWDVCVVLRDEDARRSFDERFPSVHGAMVEIASTTIQYMRRTEVDGLAGEHSRYASAHADIRIDKTGGELSALVAAREYLPDGYREKAASEALDDYINSTYRSLRYETRLDALESIAPALRTIFALAGRVRPYNKYLEWELRHHPVDGWDADELLTILDQIAAQVPNAQRELFRRIEHDARAKGFAAVVDSWEPDVAWLRGDSDYRTHRR